MPLSCDCYPGCWSAHSKNWPTMGIPRDLIEKARDRDPHYPEHTVAVRLCKKAGVPHGCYVTVERRLRVETRVFLKRIQQVLNERAG